MNNNRLLCDNRSDSGEGSADKGLTAQRKKRSRRARKVDVGTAADALRAKKAAEDDLARMKAEVAELAAKKERLERENEAQAIEARRLKAGAEARFRARAPRAYLPPATRHLCVRVSAARTRERRRRALSGAAPLVFFFSD